jgi:hypothetical protein
MANGIFSVETSYKGRRYDGFVVDRDMKGGSTSYSTESHKGGSNYGAVMLLEALLCKDILMECEQKLQPFSLKRE